MKIKYLNFLITIINLPVYFISCILPKKDNIWIFGAWLGNKYADNSKYLFEYITDKHKEVRAVWLTTNPKIIDKLKSLKKEAYYTYSIKGYFYSTIANVCFVSTGMHDVNRFATTAKIKVQLWHGTPLKYIQNDFIPGVNNFKQKLKKILFPFNVSKYKYLISPSAIVSKSFSTAFDNIEEIIICGYPRNDALAKVDCKRYITYLPTHRGQGKGDILNVFSTFCIDDIEKFLEKYNYTLLCKLHFYDLKKLTFTDTKRIKFLKDDGEDTDVYNLLTQTNILITDYSSVYFDYLLTNRPIIFTPFDLEEYLSNERGMYYDYNEVTPGPKCRNWQEVLEELEKIFNGKDEYIENRKLINDKFNYFKDFNSAERIYNIIKEKK